MAFHSFSRRRRIAGAAALSVAAALTLSGCSQIVEAFNTLQQEPNAPVVPTSSAPVPSATMMFNSLFTYDGSVSERSSLADGLMLNLDVWAQDPKRTQEWTPTASKTFGFAVNVYDERVDDKAVLAEKRRVYISQVKLTGQTAQTSGQSQIAYQFTADPRTLVPSDTIRSSHGLLLNHFQGGLLVEGQTIQQLPADTYGLTLQFEMTVAVEGSANDDASFQTQTVYEYVPIAIFAD